MINESKDQSHPKDSDSPKNRFKAEAGKIVITALLAGAVSVGGNLVVESQKVSWTSVQEAKKANMAYQAERLSKRCETFRERDGVYFILDQLGTAHIQAVHDFGAFVFLPRKNGSSAALSAANTAEHQIYTDLLKNTTQMSKLFREARPTLTIADADAVQTVFVLAEAADSPALDLKELGKVVNAAYALAKTLEGTCQALPQ